MVTQDQSRATLREVRLDEQQELLQSERLQNRYIEYLLPTAYTEVTDGVSAYAAKFEIGPEGYYERLPRAAVSDCRRDM
ncbi:MAG: hypothetical protein K0S39_854 [Paenibacillus sp.]|nr:hypothetical protein [Paenibacillus sp.]